ncbi:hypothetical protein ABBQ32_000451 [Trebouxia sp. C0010 RCD-2024]
MGTGRVPLKVNSKGKKNLECMEEMHSFMQCFSRSGTDGDAQCASFKTALDNCAAAAAKKGRQRTSINYHLGRLSRLITKSGK